MNSRKAKREARLLRKEKKTEIADSAKAAAESAEASADVAAMENWGRQLEQAAKEADAKGVPLKLPKMSVKMRKLLKVSATI